MASQAATTSQSGRELIRLGHQEHGANERAELEPGFAESVITAKTLHQGEVEKNWLQPDIRKDFIISSV